MQRLHQSQNDYIILKGGDDKARHSQDNLISARHGPSKAQIAAWAREIVEDRQREAASDIAEKNAEYSRIVAELDRMEEIAEIDYAAAIIKPKLEMQKIHRMMDAAPQLARAKALWDWAQAREEGPLKQAAIKAFYALAGEEAERILSIPQQEQTLLQLDEDNRLRREAQAREREQIRQTHERMIQHLDILKNDPAMRAYDRELLEKRIHDYGRKGADGDAPSFNSIIAMAPCMDHTQNTGRNFSGKR